ncbi:MAG: hypothetical protein H6Q60_552 [Oscillospiraceae bacterium]|nr:hypothetical protein [Oscillospiraceae bacterium]
MIIKRMCATFGTLEQATLELHEGLNIIEAPNESGKSTWAAFLRAMLFGINTRERDKKNTIAEKNLYQPWSGAPMEGTLELVWQGREITLRRYRKGSVPFGGFDAVYTASGAPIPGLTAENVGETLLGVGREVYERSAFVGQSSLVIDQTAELESRIAALASSGQEDVSFSQTQKRLREWQNRRKYNKLGLIPQMTQELSKLDVAIERVGGGMSQASAVRSELTQHKRQEEDLKRDMALHRQQKNYESLQRLQAIRAELEQKKAACLAAEAEAQRHGAAPEAAVLRSAQDNLNYLSTLDSNIRLARKQQAEAEETAQAAQASRRDESFPDCTAEEAWAQASSDRETISKHLLLADKLPAAAVVLALLGFVAGAGLGAAGALLLPAFRFPLIGGGIALFLVTVVAALLVRSRQASKHRAAAQAVYHRYPTAQTTDDILRQASSYREACAAALTAAEQESRVTQALMNLEEERTRLLRSLLDLVHPFAPEVTDTFGISAALSRALTLDDRHKTARRDYESVLRICDTVAADGIPEYSGEEPPDSPSRTVQETETQLIAVSTELTRLQRTLDFIEGELRSLGDLSGLQARRDALAEQLAARTGEYEAISLALEALESAHALLEERFSPILNRKTGEILSAFTGNKYSSVSFNRDLDAQATETGGLLPRRAAALSAGTVDQVYLAVRLAVCDITLPSDDPTPLLLDDALAFFDDRRMELALTYLSKLPRQILLFTCQHREAAFLEHTPEVSLIPLHSGVS